jgi:hypothetical protein
MKGRIALMRHSQLVRTCVFSLILGLVCLASGCGERSGSDTPSTSKELPKHAQSLKEQMQKRTATQKGAQGKGLRSGRAGR